MKTLSTLIKTAGLFPLLLFTGTIHAQSSLACYSSAPKKIDWSIGFRTGTSREYDHTYSIDDLPNKYLSWNQQVFIQNHLSRNLVLEFQTTHQNYSNDYIHNVGSPDKKYSMALRKSHRLHNNILLSYYMYTDTEEKIRLGIGVGMGVLTSFDKTMEHYTLNTGEAKEVNHAAISVNAPNLIIAMTSIYQVKKDIYSTVQFNYSNNPNITLEHLTVNIGLEYRF